MNDFIKIFKNEYYDSVSLMSIAAKLEREYKCTILVAMATPMNVELLTNLGFNTSELSCTPNDLIIAAKDLKDTNGNEIVERVFESLSNKHSNKQVNEKKYPTLELAFEDNEFNLGVVSLPGQYAFTEAMKLLQQNIHVMLFSDNVSVEEEIILKDYAIANNLLMMGPDCGTSIINNKGICFANAVKDGDIGIISASGTGLQEVSVNIDKLGKGISQAIGVGGRDLSAEVAGRMMIAVLEAMDNDSKTSTIVLISKPPVKEVKEKIISKVQSLKTKTVIYFINEKNESINSNIIFANDLYDAAYKAVYFKEQPQVEQAQINSNIKFRDTQKYIRGLFCGGTLCLEALSVVKQHGLEGYSNASKNQDEKLKDATKSLKHCMVDLGDDFFTNGKPHPMIEPSIRLDRIVQEAQDEETKVILMDFELGFGSHEDPVGITIDSINEAKRIAKEDNREIVFIGYVLGTEQDFQDIHKQESLLIENDVIVAKSNIESIEIALSYLEVSDGLI